jgi:hypothetical protein
MTGKEPDSTKMKKKIIIYLYNRFHDPLIQGNIWQYINNITAYQSESVYEFAIITYEDDRFELSTEEMNRIKADLKKRNIKWMPVKWHSGTSVVRKAVDLMQGFWILTKLRFRGFRFIVSLASVAGSFAYIGAIVLRMRLYLYQYEPHSEFAVESGIWKASSVSFRILKFLEKKSAFYASVISTGTDYMLDRLKSWNVKASLYKIPSVTNDQFFLYDSVLRKTVRDKLGIAADKKVFVYAGKFGDLYYGIEIIRVFKWLSECINNSYFLIITPQDLDVVRNWIADVKLEKNRIGLTSANYEDMPGLLSACDFGIVNIPPTPSQKFRSPIKVGEYLCCGLPYLICKGISEDDIYAKKNNVGVVVNEFSREEILNAIPNIVSLLSEPKEILQLRCRKTGVDYRGLSNLQNRFEIALQNLTNSKS